VACGPPPGDDDGDDDLPIDPGECATVPVETYDNFGKAFLTTQCNSCHAALAIDRHGAPDDVTFDDRDEVTTWSERILMRVGTEETMPPSGGVIDDDRLRLEIWLTCFPQD
jgi:uncharacterized membrane protein